MDVRNCKRCGRIYRYIGQSYCPKCAKEIDEMFLQIRDYIDENPDANVIEVSEATEIEEDIILMFLREGRLELKQPGLGLTCDRCGNPIKSGRYCDACTDEMKREFSKDLRSAEKRTEGSSRSSRQMHSYGFVHNNKGRRK